jgi:methylmalonyl-CoA epimerase
MERERGSVMFKKVRAIHVAVKNVEEAAKEYSENFGLELSRAETLPQMGIKNALFPVGDAVIEFIEPLDKEQGPIPRFLASRGEGIYMMALEVEDLDAAIKDLKAKGVVLINDDPESRGKGIPVFIHPKSARGVMIELITA